MADSEDEEAFHSAGEEEVTPPSQKSEEKPSKSGQPSSTSSGGASGKKEVQNVGKPNSKKAKGKKGKKKKASMNDKGDNSEEMKGEATMSEKDAAVSSETDQQDTKQQPHSETQLEEQNQPDADVETAEGVKSELKSDKKEERTSAVEDTPPESSKKENLKEQDDSSPKKEDSQPESELAEEGGDAKAKTDSQVPEEEEQKPHVKEDAEQLLETGSEINRDAQGASPEPSQDDDENKTLETDERTGESASASSKQTDAAEDAEAGGGRSIMGALSKLTGEKPAEKKASGGGWGWGGWGASLVSSVSAVGHGLSSVIENVETSLGLPKPEELTEQEKRQQEFIVTLDERGEGKEGKEEDGDKDEDKDEETKDPGEGEEMERDGGKEGEEEGDEKQDQSTPEDQPSVPSSMKGFLSLGASAITSVVGKTVTGGLDALETIGRKTMDVLQEGEHRLEGRRSGQKGNLSEMLRDAKEEAETAAVLEEEERERQRAHFGILFDKYQGLAHLEALEMISNQSESKVQGSLSTLSGEDLQSLKTELIEIRDAFQLEDLESEEQPEGSEQDFVNAITEHLFGVSVASTPDKLQRVQRSVHEWLAECKSQQEAAQKQDTKELHIKAIETLAEFSSRVIEQFHKACELMLLPQDREHTKNAVQRATSLSKLTSVLATEVSNQASKFADCLNREAANQEEGAETADVNPLITNIYLEASNSTSYIQDAFQLVLPVLQMVAIERKRDATTETS
ncbi:protein FAM114A2-like [Patiria miniata]|uniref:FAM114A2 n=1 Tax=Patiria miniata TaxID=46514 RepID=A0A913ZYH4_PATMI|nr:protein FAM114A2-like [Patiria miniata]